MKKLLIVFVFLGLAVAAQAEEAAVATVNGEAITQAALDAQIKEAKDQGQPMTDKALHDLVLAQMIDNMMVLQAARQADLESNAEYKQKMAKAKDRIMQEVYLYQEAQKRLTDNMLKSEYKKFLGEQKNLKEVWARHILLKNKETAESLIKELESGEDFATLASNYSIDQTAKTGGDLGYFTRDVMVPEFEYAAFALDKGDFTHEPVETRFGWHIIKVEDVRSVPTPPFEKVRPILTARAMKELLNGVLHDLRTASKVTFTEDKPQ